MSFLCCLFNFLAIGKTHWQPVAVGGSQVDGILSRYYRIGWVDPHLFHDGRPDDGGFHIKSRTVFWRMIWPKMFGLLNIKDAVEPWNVTTLTV